MPDWFRYLICAQLNDWCRPPEIGKLECVSAPKHESALNRTGFDAHIYTSSRASDYVMCATVPRQSTDSRAYIRAMLDYFVRASIPRKN